MLSFATREAANHALGWVGAGKVIRGKTAKAINQRDRPGSMYPYSVLLVGLHPATTQAELEALYPAAQSVKLKEPTYTLPEAETIEYIRNAFRVERQESLRVISQSHDTGFVPW